MNRNKKYIFTKLLYAIFKKLFDKLYIFSYKFGHPNPLDFFCRNK